MRNKTKRTDGRSRRRHAARSSALEGIVWRTINARRGFLIEKLERRILKDWEFDELKGLNILADARCVKHKAPNDQAHRSAPTADVERKEKHE